MKKVIITGATGTLGTSLIKNLIKKNIEILVIANPYSKRNKNIIDDKLVKIIECDLSDYDKLENVSNDIYDVFYHFAWSGTFGKDREDIFKQEKNIENSIKAVNLAKRFNCKKIIFSGSQAEYGIKKEKLTENMEMNPITEYGKAKLKTCEETKKLANKIGIKHIWVRILSLYGPNDLENTLVMSMIKSILAKKEFDLTKCEQIWDYLYSDDASCAFIKIGDIINEDKIYVIGSGDNITLKEYVEKIKKVVDKNIKLNYGKKEYSKNQTMYLTTDANEIKKDLNWRKETEFEEGIKKILKENFGVRK